MRVHILNVISSSDHHVQDDAKSATSSLEVYGQHTSILETITVHTMSHLRNRFS